MHSSKSLVVVAMCTAALAGCELIVHFDDTRLDAGGSDVVGSDMPSLSDAADASSEAGNDVVTDAADAGADAGSDVVMDGRDGTPTDVPHDNGTDVQQPVDTGVDVPAVDAQPDVVTDTGVDVATDTGPALLNGCTAATATDLTGDATPTVTFPGTSLQYAPPCVRIHPGQTVTFAPSGGASFADHPLVGGTVTGATATPDGSSPIGSHSSGIDPVVVTFATAGSYGFYCSVHFTFGMEGAVFVAP